MYAMLGVGLACAWGDPEAPAAFDASLRLQPACQAHDCIPCLWLLQRQQSLSLDLLSQHLFSLLVLLPQIVPGLPCKVVRNSCKVAT